MPPSPAVSLTEEFRGVERRLREWPSSSAAMYSIAGIPIRFHFGSQSLRDRISPAFRHLESAQIAEPSLHVFIHERGAILEDARFASEPILSGGEDHSWLDESPEVSVIVQKRGQVVTAVDWKRGAGYWLVPDAESISYIERARPLQQLLVYWLGKQGRYLVHGAAVGSENGGVLILGQGGAGKSTTALACLEEGMRYVADDYCLVSLDDGPSVHSIYGTAKLAFEELHRFPSLAPAGDLDGRPPEEKVVFFLGVLPAIHFARSLKLRAVLLARIANLPRTCLCPIGSAEAFRAIVPSCALHHPAARAQALKCFNGLVRRLPAYALELGADMRSTPAAIRELLAGLPATS